MSARVRNYLIEQRQWLSWRADNTQLKGFPTALLGQVCLRPSSLPGKMGG